MDKGSYYAERPLGVADTEYSGKLGRKVEHWLSHPTRFEYGGEFNTVDVEASQSGEAKATCPLYITQRRNDEKRS